MILYVDLLGLLREIDKEIADKGYSVAEGLTTGQKEAFLLDFNDRLDCIDDFMERP